MPNAQEITDGGIQQLLLVGRTGSGKTTQFLTLPGAKFLYIFDPAALATIKGYDVEYELFLPDVLEMDATIKRFNKDARPSDKPSSEREPRLYVEFVNHLNELVESGRIKDFSWVGFDSLTLLSKAIMDRQLWINKRYGEVEDIADFKIVGAKLSDMFRSITSVGCNIFCTGHVETFQDDKTKRLAVELALPGRSRRQLPLMFSNVWNTYFADGKWWLRTIPEDRGLADIRSSIRGLTADVDVTVDFAKPLELQGIGGIIQRANGAAVPTTKGAKSAVHRS